MAFKRTRSGLPARMRQKRRTFRRARRTTRRLPSRVQKILNNSGETKYISQFLQFSQNSYGNSLPTALANTFYKGVSVFPSAGTGNSQRVGNTINNAKLHIEIKILAYFSVEFQPCFEVRVILFSLPGLGVVEQTGNINSFFKTPDTNCNNIMFQDVNRENIRVYMDKIYTMKQLTAGYSASQDISLEHNVKTIHINKRFKKLIFLTGSAIPKYSNQVLYVSVLSNAINATQRLSQTQIRSKLYYKDN